MVFKNYLTTPSGRFCQIQDICNQDYQILIKYLQGEDYKNFFTCLTEITKRDIEDFDNFDIIEKCYIWIAMCMYSIRSTIEVTNKQLGSQEVNVSLILDNIESSYIPNKTIDYNIKDNFVLNFEYPCQFSFENNFPVIDFYSGLKSINGHEVTEEQKIQLIEKLPTKHKTFIESSLREGFSNDFDLFNGVPMNSLTMNLCSESLIANVISFYRMPLDAFYHVLYAIIKHLRMSYSDYMKISQVESTILLKHVAEENKAMAENAKGGDIGTIGRMIANND